MRAAAVFLLFLALGVFPGEAQADLELVSCVGHPGIQEEMSRRLQQIAAEDQADRAGRPEVIDWSVVTPRDIKRRIEVGEIFGRGCFSTAADYAAGAIIYQHGDTADHAFQAFIWSKRGLDLGDQSQKWWVSASLDRYLMRIGHKQLFATQYSKPVGEQCWCLEPVEGSFSEEVRVSYTGKTLNQAFEGLKGLNQDREECAATNICREPKKDSPQGTVPGFW